MKKVQIQKKDLKLNDFSTLAIDTKQEKQVKGGDDVVLVDYIVIVDTNL